MIVAAGDGVFYVRETDWDNGALYRFHYQADSQRWVQYAKPVDGGGWNMHRRVFSPGGDVLYAVENNTEGTLWWYRWLDSSGTWATPRPIGGGWPADWQIGAMTDGCSASGLPVPRRPAPRQVQELARGELIESRNGLIQGFYVSAFGELKAVTQSAGSPIDFLNIAPVESPSPISTTPSAIMTKDGQPNVYALGTTTDTFEATRTGNGFAWPKLSSFGGWTTGPTKAVKYADRRKQFFAVDAQGRLIARGQHVVDAL